MVRVIGFALATALVAALGAPSCDRAIARRKLFHPRGLADPSRKLFKCHGMDSQKANLRLDFPEAIRRGGEFGKVIEPGEPDESVLIELISLPADDPDLMPGEGEKLSDEQIATLRRWIEGGAPYGDWTPEFAFKALGMGTIGGAPEGSPEAALEAIAASSRPRPRKPLTRSWPQAPLRTAQPRQPAAASRLSSLGRQSHQRHLESIGTS
jgi:hypothetical protein